MAKKRKQTKGPRPLFGRFFQVTVCEGRPSQQAIDDVVSYGKKQLLKEIEKYLVVKEKPPLFGGIGSYVVYIMLPKKPMLPSEMGADAY